MDETALPLAEALTALGIDDWAEDVSVCAVESVSPDELNVLVRPQLRGKDPVLLWSDGAACVVLREANLVHAVRVVDRLRVALPRARWRIVHRLPGETAAQVAARVVRMSPYTGGAG